MNKKPELIEYLPGHFGLIELNAHAESIGKLYLSDMCANAHCKTIVYRGKIIAILGSAFMHHGCYYVFVVPSKHISMCRLGFFKIVRNELARLFSGQLVRRVQSTAHDSQFFNDWMVALGFRWEGTMLSYSPTGETYRMWAKVNPNYGAIPQLEFDKQLHNESE
jgi:hypothetical protein